MRDFNEMMTLIMAEAEKLNVLAVGQNGSRTNKKAPVDRWQDFDIVFIVDNISPLIQEQSWLADFGEQLIMQQPDAPEFLAGTNTTRYHFLMQFADGNRIDLTLLARSEVETWLKEDALIEILADPHQLLPQLPAASDSTFWVKEPSFTDFAACCNEFFWVSLYVAKGLARGELFYATDHYYDNCRGELLRLLSWEVGFAHDFHVSVGKNYKYLANFVPAELMKQLYELQDLSSTEKMWDNLIALQELFLAHAKDVNRRFVESEDFATDENVIAYTKKWAAESLNK